MSDMPCSKVPKLRVFCEQADLIGLQDILGHAAPPDEAMKAAAQAGRPALSKAFRKLNNVNLAAVTTEEVRITCLLMASFRQGY